MGSCYLLAVVRMFFCVALAPDKVASSCLRHRVQPNSVQSSDVLLMLFGPCRAMGSDSPVADRENFRAALQA